MSIVHSCGCKDPDVAFVVEYESEDCDAEVGFQPVIVTASMCAFHLICQVTHKQLISARRIGPLPGGEG
jgi:hypothetical protein